MKRVVVRLLWAVFMCAVLLGLIVVAGVSAQERLSPAQLKREYLKQKAEFMALEARLDKKGPPRVRSEEDTWRLHQQMLAVWRAGVAFIYSEPRPMEDRLKALATVLPSVKGMTPTPFMRFYAGDHEHLRKIRQRSIATSIHRVDSLETPLPVALPADARDDFNECVGENASNPGWALVALSNMMRSVSCPITPAAYVDFTYWQTDRGLRMQIEHFYDNRVERCNVAATRIIGAFSARRLAECAAFWTENQIFTDDELRRLADLLEGLEEPVL